MTRTLFALNPALDLSPLAEEFARRSRLQIRDVLRPEAAEAIRHILERETAWGIAWQAKGREPANVRAEALRTMPRDEQAKIARETAESARRGEFSFVYHQYPLVQAYLQKWQPGHPLELLLEHVNDAPLIEMIRTVTGIPELIKADGQATLYAPGDFLGSHDDSIHGDGRRIAYVFNFAREWHPEWGGYLLFLDEHGDVSAGFRPRFNSLNLFRVPQRHIVTYVPPHAALERYALTGWFRDR
jgi:SM-20-related protein